VDNKRGLKSNLHGNTAFGVEKALSWRWSGCPGTRTGNCAGELKYLAGLMVVVGAGCSGEARVGADPGAPLRPARGAMSPGCRARRALCSLAASGGGAEGSGELEGAAGGRQQLPPPGLLLPAGRCRGEGTPSWLGAPQRGWQHPIMGGSTPL